MGVAACVVLCVLVCVIVSVIVCADTRVKVFWGGTCDWVCAR